jgi:16S rRNA G966 N2-methylase RsmD
VFHYFGRKARAAKTYPAPDYPLIIEPFAGSMAYSLTHRPAQAIGIERDENTHALWHRLASMTAEEIRNYPPPVVGERSTDRYVITTAQGNGAALSNYRTVTPFMVEHFEKQRTMTLRHHAYARTVLYSLGDYRQAPDVECTWFIDPPYQGVKGGYRHHQIDYAELAEWCMTRRGQVIVCEGNTATWLPFEHHVTFRGMPSFGKTARPVAEHVLTRTTHARCKVCSMTFPASRSDARYCSARCRQRARRS